MVSGYLLTQQNMTNQDLLFQQYAILCKQIYYELQQV